MKTYIHRLMALLVPMNSLYHSNSPESQLWDVLTALRGPDNDDNYVSLKQATTAVIRYTLGIRPDNCVNCVADFDSKENLEIRIDLDKRGRASIYYTSHHFVHHARRAFEALGLKWDKVNK